MSKLKLGAIEDDKPVKLTIEFPPAVHRKLVAYAAAIGQESEKPAPDPGRIVPAMIDRFMATDRAFQKIRKSEMPPRGRNV